MTVRKTQSRAQMIEELRRLQADLTENWVDRSLPDAWQALDSEAPESPPRVRITIRLDADMVRWFRKLGPGYGRRINRVLRIYWLALLSGKVAAHWDEDAAGPRFAAYLERQMEILDRQRAERRGD